jgi:hypothetical protein
MIGSDRRADRSGDVELALNLELFSRQFSRVRVKSRSRFMNEILRFVRFKGQLKL